MQQLSTALAKRRRIQLGDTPDTSKALRSLVAAGLVVRHGRGGRHDAFKYQVLTHAILDVWTVDTRGRPL